MENVQGFCGPCFGRVPDPPPTDADDNAYTLHGGATSVRRYLRKHASVHPSHSSGLETVANHYAKISELIGPAIQEDGRARYATFIGNLDAQRQHARQVLGPIRDEMAAAARVLEELAV